MKPVELAIAFVFLTKVVMSDNSCHSELESRVDVLSAEFRRLANEHHELEKKTVQPFWNWPSTMFDCYLTDDWSTNGPIIFNGCSGTKIQHSNSDVSRYASTESKLA